MKIPRKAVHRIIRFKSKSDPTKFHHTERTVNGDIFCTCKGWEFRRDCVHAKSAQTWK